MKGQFTMTPASSMVNSPLSFAAIIASSDFNTRGVESSFHVTACTDHNGL